MQILLLLDKGMLISSLYAKLLGCWLQPYVEQTDMRLYRSSYLALCLKGISQILLSNYYFNQGKETEAEITHYKTHYKFKESLIKQYIIHAICTFSHCPVICYSHALSECMCAVFILHFFDLIGLKQGDLHIPSRLSTLNK